MQWAEGFRMLGLVARRIRKAKVSEFVNLNASFEGPVFTSACIFQPRHVVWLEVCDAIKFVYLTV